MLQSSPGSPLSRSSVPACLCVTCKMCCGTLCLWETPLVPSALPPRDLSCFAVCASKQDLRGTGVREGETNPIVNIGDSRVHHVSRLGP